MNSKQINRALETLANDKRADALRELTDLDHKTKVQKYSKVPSFAITKRKFSDSTSNGLTNCVIAWLHLNNHYAVRVTTTGRIINSEPVIDSIGRTRLMKGKWIPGTTKKGTADCHAIIAGKHISLEIKVGADRMSEYQHKAKTEVETAGGIYLTVTSFSQFLSWYRAHMATSATDSISGE